MKYAEDLFGKALSDVYHNRKKEPFYVCDDAGRETPLDLEFYVGGGPEEYEKQVLNSVTGKILDVGCGAGRITKYLQDKGLNVVGFDIDSIAIHLCKERRIKNVFVGDFNNIEQFGVFDSILFLNRTICIAGSLEAVRALLKKCYNYCSPNGILIFDSYEVNPELTKDTPDFVQNKLWFKYEGRFGKPFQRIYYSSSVARKLLKDSGWVEEKIAKYKDVYCMLCRRI